MNVIRTQSPKGEAIVILAERDYDDLLFRAMAAEDAAQLRASQERLIRSEEETLSIDEVKALRCGTTPLAFWRTKRQITQADLAARIGITQGFLSDIENGKKLGDIRLYRRLARALHVDLDDIAPD